jgi:hypothetical protein
MIPGGQYRTQIRCMKLVRWVAMEIGFDTAELARLASSSRLLRARWGESGGRRVGARLLQMRAAPALADLARMPGRCRLLPECTSVTLAIDVADHAVIIFRPIAPSRTAQPLQPLDWAGIRRVSITDFEDR